MTNQHCDTCSCGTVEYGITMIDGPDKGNTYGPLSTQQICGWNRNHWRTARLAIRVLPETKWRRASDGETQDWNLNVMVPHVTRGHW